MSLRCPECGRESFVTASDIGPAGRMVACPACGTRWLARRFEGDPYGRPASGPERIADAPIIEHVGAGFSPPPRAVARGVAAPALLVDARVIRGAVAACAALAGLLVLRAPILAMLAGGPGGLWAKVADLQFEDVRSQTVHIHGSPTLLVEGEIANTSTADVTLPAIRITLRSNEGTAVKSWLVEPAVAGLAAGDSIGFRSALASPPAEATQVTLDLAAREGS
jgi:predicted Zn finger-like uncharacterized protein